MPYPYVALNDNFNSGTATNWTAPYGGWSVTSQAYGRPGYLGPGIKVFIQSAVTNNHVGDGPWPTAWTNAYSFLAKSLTYSNKTFAFYTAQDMFVGIKHGTGTASIVVDDIAITSWKGLNYTNSDGWKMFDAWVITNVPPSNMAIELWRSRAYPTGGVQAVASKVFPNGIGVISFDITVANPPATILIEQSIAPFLGLYSTVKTKTYTSAGTTRSKFYVQTPATNASVRIRHVSANKNTKVTIDNVEITESVARNSSMWYAYNAMITYNQDTREFEPAYVPCLLYTSPSPRDS